MYDLSDSEDARDRDIEERSNGGSKEKQGEAPAAVAAVAAASGCAAAGGCAAVDWAVSCATDDAGMVAARLLSAQGAWMRRGRNVRVYCSDGDSGRDSVFALPRRWLIARVTGRTLQRLPARWTCRQKQRACAARCDGCTLDTSVRPIPTSTAILCVSDERLSLTSDHQTIATSLQTFRLVELQSVRPSLPPHQLAGCQQSVCV